MPPIADDRDWVERLIFGRENARRFTQDSPILPDVWIAFAGAPSEPQPLLLTPNMEPDNACGPTTTGMLRKVLAERIPVERQRPAAWCRKGRRKPPAVELAHNQATVLVTLWFDELVRVILPMSAWWRERVHPTGYDEELGGLDLEREGILARMLENPDLSAEELGVRPNHVKPAPDLLWTVRVVGTIALTRKRQAVLERVRAGADFTLADFKNVAAAADALFEEVRLPDYDSSPLVWSVSRNRLAETTVERSRQAVKADAAARVFEASCATLTWAVIDSGIDATHPAFRKRDAKNGQPFSKPFADGNQTRVKGTYDFTYVQYILSTARDADAALPEWFRQRLKSEPALKKKLKAFRQELDRGAEIDWGKLTPFIQIPHDDAAYVAPVHEHGTHVAGILAADWDPPGGGASATEPTPPRGGLHGVCPDMQLYDLRVLNDQGAGEEFNIISALQFIRYLNSRQDFMAAHGVNLSLSLRHDVANYACGRTPVCEECERLVATGVVVVAAAGNRGFQRYVTASGPLESYHSISITDPGNATGVITVGATHRMQPHVYGVSYFSSRGPTGDGRLKPDLVAPGEKIEAPVPGAYKRMDGTSMAAPHVSGVAALLLARHRELIGQPGRVKEVLCRTATDLGRERFFQGHGMVDALRALQSI